MRALACAGVLASAGATAASAVRHSATGIDPVTLASANPWPIVELRQYTLHAGQRDVLIELFEREFIESQEAVGMEVLAHAREPDAPDRFVWFRGFHDMPSRAQALQAFYFGPVWQAHREAANATIIDSDNVLLLREARPGSGFLLPQATRAAVGAAPTQRVLVATIYSFATPVDDDFLDFFAGQLAPATRDAGAQVLASYVSERSANNFPRLPVREGENVFVWVAGFEDQHAYAAYLATLEHSPHWQALQGPLAQRLQKPAETHRLAPAARSLVRG
jgi:hypothetical protein